MKTFIITLNILLCTSLLLHAQAQNSKINNKFSGTWINSKFANKLQSGYTPYEATSMQPTISAICFPARGDSLLFIYNFHETNWYRFRRIDDTQIVTLKRYPHSKIVYRLFIEKRKDDYCLIFCDGKDSVEFSFYEQEYPSVRVPSELINKTWLSGEYVPENNKSRVMFYDNEKTTGLNNYVFYKVAYDFQGPPGYDYIKFYPGDSRAIYDIYAWHFNKDTLILSKIFIDERFNFSKDTLQIKLIKKSN